MVPRKAIISRLLSVCYTRKEKLLSCTIISVYLHLQQVC